MKKIISFLALTILFSIHVSYAQPQKTTDSLLAALKNCGEDTNKSNTLNLLAKQYHQMGDVDAGKKYAQEALQLSKKITWKKGEANSYLSIGLNFFYRGEYDDALKNYLTSLKLYEELEEKKGIVRCYNNMGLVYTYKGNYEEGKKCHLAGLTISKELHDTANMARAYNNLGIICDDQGNYPEALTYYYDALKIAEKQSDKKALADVYVNIGLVNSNLDKYDEALKNYDLSLKYAEEIGYKEGVGNCYGNMAIAYKYKKDYPKALEYQKKVLQISEETHNAFGLGMSHTEMANIYSNTGKFPEAMEHIKKAQKIFYDMGNPVDEGGSWLTMGIINRKMNHYAEAIQNINKALDAFEKAGSKDRIANAYGVMSDVYRDMKDYDNAYKYVKLYQELHDTLYSERSNKEIAEIKTRYETEKKDAEIVLLNKDKEVKEAEIKKQKTLKYSFIGGLAGLALLTLIGYNNINVRNKLKLQTLRNKIASDLHDDVGSTLSSISIFSEVAQQQSKEVIPMLNTINESARNMLDAMADIVWTINPENDQFEKIILRMRSFAYELLGAKKIDFEFDADDHAGKLKMPMDVRKNLYLIFKEATNNLVKYSEANKARFSLKGEKNNLTMLIQDNGKGFDINSILKGNGLKNMRRRAEEIGAKLLIDSAPGNGTTIRLTVYV